MKNKSEIFVVFGKELKGNTMTFEYKDRIDCMINYFELMGYLSNEKNMMPESSKILFTGGQKMEGYFSEARMGHNYFETKLSKSKIILPNDIIELDINAKNTAENIENVLEMIENKTEKFLYLISTDYHIERLERIDRLLPQNGSLIAKIRKIDGLNYGFLRSEYRYLFDDDEIKRWQAQLYLDAENFKIMESNLVSIVHGETDVLLKSIIDHFPKDLNEIEKTLDKMLEAKKIQDCRVFEIFKEVHSSLLEMNKFHVDLINFINKSDKNLKAWEDKSNLFKKTLREIIITVDPDEPITNGVSKS